MRVALICNSLIAVLFSTGSLINARLALTAPFSNEYLEQGLRYRQQERYPEAIAALEKSVDQDPR